MKYGVIKCAVSSYCGARGDVYGNALRIGAQIRLAHGDGAEFILFPQLCLSGGAINTAVCRASEVALKKLAASTKARSILVAVGLPLMIDGRPISAMAVLLRGMIAGIVPNCPIGRAESLTINGFDVPFGNLTFFQDTFCLAFRFADNLTPQRASLTAVTGDADPDALKRILAYSALYRANVLSVTGRDKLAAFDGLVYDQDDGAQLLYTAFDTEEPSMFPYAAEQDAVEIRLKRGQAYEPPPTFLPIFTARDDALETPNDAKTAVCFLHDGTAAARLIGGMLARLSARGAVGSVYACAMRGIAESVPQFTYVPVAADANGNAEHFLMAAASRFGAIPIFPTDKTAIVYGETVYTHPSSIGMAPFCNVYHAALLSAEGETPTQEQLVKDYIATCAEKGFDEDKIRYLCRAQFTVPNATIKRLATIAAAHFAARS